MTDDTFLEDIMIMEAYKPLKDNPRMREFMDKKYGTQDWYFMTAYESKSSGLVEKSIIDRDYSLMDEIHERLDFDGNLVQRDMYKKNERR